MCFVYPLVFDGSPKTPFCVYLEHAQICSSTQIVIQQIVKFYETWLCYVESSLCILIISKSCWYNVTHYMPYIRLWGDSNPTAPIVAFCVSYRKWQWTCVMISRCYLYCFFAQIFPFRLGKKCARVFIQCMLYKSPLLQNSIDFGLMATETHLLFYRTCQPRPVVILWT